MTAGLSIGPGRTEIGVSSWLHPSLDATGRVLLLTPSRGLGGGIERYVETLEWAFARQGVPYERIDLDRPGPAAQARMMIQARKLLRASPPPSREMHP